MHTDFPSAFASLHFVPQHVAPVRHPRGEKGAQVFDAMVRAGGNARTCQIPRGGRSSCKTFKIRLYPGGAGRAVCSYYRGYAVAGLLPADVTNKGKPQRAPGGAELGTQDRVWPTQHKLKRSRLEVPFSCDHKILRKKIYTRNLPRSQEKLREHAKEMLSVRKVCLSTSTSRRRVCRYLHSSPTTGFLWEILAQRGQLRGSLRYQ